MRLGDQCFRRRTDHAHAIVMGHVPHTHFNPRINLSLLTTATPVPAPLSMGDVSRRGHGKNRHEREHASETASAQVTLRGTIKVYKRESISSQSWIGFPTEFR